MCFCLRRVRRFFCIQPTTFKRMMIDGWLCLQSAIAQPKDVIELVENYFIVRNDDDRGTLVDATIDGVIAIQYCPRVLPVTQDTTVAGIGTHVSPAEGTA